MIGVLWTVVTLPFRLIAWLIDLVGRATVLVLGFALMVVGVALSAGALFIFGIPLFVIGLLLALRAIG
jgi:hypothetical protein